MGWFMGCMGWMRQRLLLWKGVKKLQVPNSKFQIPKSVQWQWSVVSGQMTGDRRRMNFLRALRFALRLCVKPLKRQAVNPF
jgi:hypothetical protein